MNALHLDERHLAMVRKVLARHAPGLEVRAFGSRVHGHGLRKFSDLDLAVVTSSPLTLEQSGELREAFEESNLPIKVDVIDWASTSAEFRKIIQENYVVVQEGAAD